MSTEYIQQKTIDDMKYEGEVTIITGKCEKDVINPPIIFPYECDHFQKHAFNCITNNEDIMVTAHTGSGKTTVAEYAVMKAISEGKTVVYTTPIKSLSNEKYNEFKKKFETLGVSVGIMTGDNKINPEGNCIIMTAEILWNALFRKDEMNDDKDSEKKADGRIELKEDFVNKISIVIMDEVHYINDHDRGHVWEGTIVMLPKSVKLVLLSATVNKAENFAKWVSKTRGSKINLIPTTHRVVPLNHYIYIPTLLNIKMLNSYRIMDNDNKYNQDICIKVRKDYMSLKHIREKKFKNQKPLEWLNNMVVFLKKENLLQAIFFSFSKRNCEKYASMIVEQLVSHEEAINISGIFSSFMKNYDKEYSKLDQYNIIKKYIMKGIAFHHAGLLPILKEIIELLFKKGLIKILFATETFAVGVNMPTRTVIFTELEKYSHSGKRFLTPAEYKQMAGRAGRRGIDITGNVFIMPLHDFPEEQDLRDVLLGKISHITSQFKIDYTFILKTLHKVQINKLDNPIDQVKEIMNKSLFSSEMDSIILGIQTELKQAENALYEKFGNNSENYITTLKNAKDLIAMYDLENSEKTQSVNFGFTVVMSKDQIKKKQKLYASIDKNNYAKYCEYMAMKTNISTIKSSLISNIEYINSSIDHIVAILQANGYIDFKNMLTLKGTVASQINECNQILLTEMIVNDLFAGMLPEEIVAMLSIFVEPEKSDDYSKKKLNDVCKSSHILSYRFYNIEQIIKNNIELEESMGYHNQNSWKITYDFADAAFSWTLNEPISITMNYTGEMYIGQFCKNMIKISNLSQDMIHICELVGKNEVIPVLSKISEKIIRDFVNINSIYLSNYTDQKEE